jgi:hypothetical protein
MLYQIVDPKPAPVILPDNLPPTPPPPAVTAANRRREVGRKQICLRLIVNPSNLFYRIITIVYPNMIIEISFKIMENILVE